MLVARSFWIGVWFVTLSLLVSAQGLRAPVEDPPDLPKLLRELRESPDAAHAALRADALRTAGQKAREGILKILGDPQVPLHVMDGILLAYLEKNDRGEGTIDALTTLYARSGGIRKDRLAAALRRYDQSGPVLDEPLARLLAGEGNGTRIGVIEITVALTNTDTERRDVIRTLIEVLRKQEGKDELPEVQVAEAAARGLAELTWHDPRPAAAWAQWLDTFLAAHPDGFPERALIADAIREAKQGAGRRGIDEAKRAIQIMVANKLLPVEYCDQSTTPDAEVRSFAAERCVAAAAQTSELGPLAVSLLGGLLDDADGGVRQVALRGLASLAQADQKLGPKVGEIASKRLGDPDLKMVDLAVHALRWSRATEYGRPLEDLYTTLKRNPDPEARAIRRGIVSALSGQAAHEAFIQAALSDEDAEVRIAAGNSLLLLPKLENALVLARVLKEEREAPVRQSFARALGKLRRFEDPVISSTLIEALEVSTDAGVTRVLLDTLVQSFLVSRDASPSAAERARILSSIQPLWPDRAGDKAARAAIIARLAETSIPEEGMKPLRTLLSEWVLVETERELRLSLVGILAKMRPLEAAPLLALADRLASRGFVGSTEALLLPLLDAPRDALDAAARTQTRQLLAEVWIENGVKDDQKSKARTLLDDEVKNAPESLGILALRGRLRLRLGDYSGAIQDLERATQAGSNGGSAELRWEWTLDLARASLLAGQPQRTLDELSAAEFLADRRARILRASGHRALNQWGAAIKEAEAALGSPAPPSDEEALQLRVRLGLEAPVATERARVAELLPRLEKAPLLAGFLIEAKAAILADQNLSIALENLAAATDPSVQRTLSAELEKADPIRFATFALHGLAELKDEAILTVLPGRFLILKKLFADDKTIAAASLPLPPTPAAARDLIASLQSWWSSRPIPSAP